MLAIGTTLVDELVGDDARAVDDGRGLWSAVTVDPRVGTVGQFAPCDHGRAFGERVRLLLDGLRVPFGCSAVEVHVHGGGASVLPLVRLRVEFAVGVHDAEHDACHVLSLGEVLRLLSEVAFDDVGGLDGGHDVAPWVLCGIAPENFFLVTVWSSEALAAGTSASTPNVSSVLRGADVEPVMIQRL